MIINILCLLMSIYCIAYPIQASQKERTEEVSFEFKKLDDSVHSMTVITPYGSLSFEFHPVQQDELANDRPYYAYMQRAAGKNVVDIWPVNGSYPTKVNDLFSKKALQDLRAQAQIANAMSSEQVRLFVLDLKGKHDYQNLNAIKNAEDLLQKLFLLQKPKRAIHNRLEESAIEFFLREGLLKALLVTKVFPPELRRFFDSYGSTHKAGRALFCMLCEFIMNGFKLGYAVHIGEHILHPQEFFEYAQPLSPTTEVPHDTVRQAVRLCTLYSKAYKETYSATSAYFKAVESFFKVAHTLHENGVTQITLECP